MANYIDQLLDQYLKGENDQVSLIEAKRRWMRMNEKAKAICDEKATAMGWILDTITYLGQLPPGEGGKALAALGIKSRSTLKYRVDQAREFKEKHPKEMLSLMFVNGAGRRPNQILTVEEQILVIGTYASIDWNVIADPDQGIWNKSNIKLQAPHVYNLATLIFPSITEKMSVEALRRFLDKVAEDDPVSFTYSWEGAQKVWAEFLLKLPSTIREPDICLQSDGRDLPFYALSAEGIPSTITLVPVVEGFDGLVPSFRIVFKTVKDESGEQKSVNFRNEDVRMVFGEAMELLKCRPYFFYTDNGGQFQALEKLMYLLEDGDHEKTILICGYPYHPWGRGLTEVIQKLVDSIFKGQPGFVENENDRNAWNAAKSKATFSEKLVTTLINRYFKKWNIDPRKDQPSRAVLYEQTPRTTRLSLPSPERLFHFKSGTKFLTRKVRDGLIEWDHDTWRPKKLDIAARDRLLDVANKSVPVWETVYTKLDGRRERKVYTILDGKTPEELVKATEELPGPQRRVDDQKLDLRRIDQRMSTLREATDQILAKADISRGQLFADTVEKTLGPAEMTVNRGASVSHAESRNDSTPESVTDGSLSQDKIVDQVVPSETSSPPNQTSERKGRRPKDQQAIAEPPDQPALEGNEADSEHTHSAKPNLADMLHKLRAERTNIDQV